MQSRPPIRVLLIAPRRNDTLEWNTALEVQGYETLIRGPDDLSRLKLAEYDVISLINVPSLPDDVWYQLGQYVQGGGGLAVLLGSREIKSFNYARDEPQAFLPEPPTCIHRRDCDICE